MYAALQKYCQSHADITLPPQSLETACSNTRSSKFSRLKSAGKEFFWGSKTKLYMRPLKTKMSKVLNQRTRDTIKWKINSQKTA